MSIRLSMTPYMSLKVSYICILQANKILDGFSPSITLTARFVKQHPNRLCDYHEKQGYWINECYKLKWYVEELIKDKKLREFVDQKETQQGEEGDKEEILPSSLMILGLK